MRVLLNRIWIQLSTDKRKFGLFSVLVLAGLLLWARIIVISNLPRTVVAGEQGPEAVANGRASGEEAAPPADREAARPRVRLSREPARDPFVISPDHYPKRVLVTDLDSERGKSDGQQTEDAQRAEARINAQLKTLLDRFRVEAVLTEPPMAVINNRTYRLGSWIPAVGNEQVWFQLVEVRSRRVILEYEGRRFELRIPTPGE